LEDVVARGVDLDGNVCEVHVHVASCQFHPPKAASLALWV
jgi:hypothetical protein